MKIRGRSRRGVPPFGEDSPVQSVLGDVVAGLSPASGANPGILKGGGGGNFPQKGMGRVQPPTRGKSA